MKTRKGIAKNAITMLCCAFLVAQSVGLEVFAAKADEPSSGTVFAMQEATQSSNPLLGNTQTLSFAEGKQAVYSAKADVKSGEGVAFVLKSATEATMFALENGGMTICGATVGGTYGAGVYGVKIYVNPDQDMVSVEVTLPDGGVVRRAFYESIQGLDKTAASIQAYALSQDRIKDILLEQVDISSSQYTLNEEMPECGLIYSVITSYEDAQTTRNFAWTQEYGGVGVFRYKKSKSKKWIEMNGNKVPETVEVYAEDYYKVNLTDLSANTSYDYQIGYMTGSVADIEWTPTYTFKTAPKKVKDFSFVAIGDTQGISWAGEEIDTKGFMFAEAAYKEAFRQVPDPAFILHTGDVVERGDNPELWMQYFQTLGDKAYSVPHFVAIGNHDAIVKNEDTFFDYHFNHPSNAGSKVMEQSYATNVSPDMQTLMQKSDEMVYSFNYGNVHITVLNSGNYTANDEYVMLAQKEWLKRDLQENADAEWKIVMLHDPVYKKHGVVDYPWLQEIIEDNGVDLVLQGHSHLETRTYPMKDGKVVTKKNPSIVKKNEGTVYLTIGATALNHDKNDGVTGEMFANIATPKNEQAAYTLGKMENGSLTITIKQLNGLVLDSFTIQGEPTKDYTLAIGIGCASLVVVATGIAVFAIVKKKKNKKEDE